MIVYSDGTALNSFGTAKSWPVYIWFGNVNVDIALNTRKVERMSALSPKKAREKQTMRAIRQFVKKNWKRQ